MKKIFIDGSSGTTGLRIRERLTARTDLELIELPDAFRKDVNARRDALHAADVAFLCLPDAAAIEAAELAGTSQAAIIDTSTAHRTAEGWTYGFPELTGKRSAIGNSKRIANPGCHASGFISLVAPLVETGMIKKDAALSCFSVTGYSGGGKKMIAEYEAQDRSKLLDAPRQYGIAQQHKHLKEMQIISGLNIAPVFCPVVAPYYSGMEVTVSLFRKDVTATVNEICEMYRVYYPGPVVHFEASADEDGFFSAAAFAGRDDLQITVSGNDERILLVSRFDNLGKGASGAAIQNMNILLGLEETLGLDL